MSLSLIAIRESRIPLEDIKTFFKNNHFKSPKRNSKMGNWGNLGFRIRNYSICEIYLYEITNSNKKIYDYKNMSKQTQYKYAIICKRLQEFARPYGVILEYSLNLSPEDIIKESYVTNPRLIPDDYNFDLNSYDGDCKNLYKRNIIPNDIDKYDRDNKIILNGDIKFFRTENGYLSKGVAYKKINPNSVISNEWFIISNKELIVKKSNELFDLNDKDIKLRRDVPEKVPIKYKTRIENIHNASTKELIGELKRRSIYIKYKMPRKEKTQ